jgi:cell division protein FtsZ
VLLSIQGGSDLGLFEINEAARLVQEAAHPEANIIFGAVIDDALGDEVRVTVIAAGFDGGAPTRKRDDRALGQVSGRSTAAPADSGYTSAYSSDYSSDVYSGNGSAAPGRTAVPAGTATAASAGLGSLPSPAGQSTERPRPLDADPLGDRVVGAPTVAEPVSRDPRAGGGPSTPSATAPSGEPSAAAVGRPLSPPSESLTVDRSSVGGAEQTTEEARRSVEMPGERAVRAPSPSSFSLDDDLDIPEFLK